MNSLELHNPAHPLFLETQYSHISILDRFFFTNNLAVWVSKDVVVSVWFVHCRGTSILGEVRNVEISGGTQQLLCSKYHDFLAVFALAHSKINQIA